jgi:hypothetical protein
MSKFKLFLTYVVVNIIVFIIPFGVLFLTTSLEIKLDFSYFAWYLLLIPLMANIITLIYVKKEDFSFVFMPIFVIISYLLSYYLFTTFVTAAFSNFNPTI